MAPTQAPSPASTKHGPPSSSSTTQQTTETSETSAAGATKRVRTSRPKVKTGCSNCNSRPYEEIRIAPKPAPLGIAPHVAPAHTPIHAAAPAVVSVPVLAPALALASAPSPRAPAGPGPVRSPGPSLSPSPSSSCTPPKPQKPPRRVTKRRAQKALRRRSISEQKPEITDVAPIAAANVIADGRCDVLTMLYQPTTGLPLTPQEGLYFQQFRIQTANELSGFFDSGFWSRIVLIECHSEAAIRHAVVALGALYRTLEATTASPPSSPSSTDDKDDTVHAHWQVALKHYSDACKKLAFVNSDDDQTQRTRLMASVLLACFDSFIGHHKHAIRQIQTGLGLLHLLRIRRRSAMANSRNPSEPVEDELIQMFTRLAIQAKSYDMAFHFPQPYVVHLLSSGSPAAVAAGSTADNLLAPSSISSASTFHSATAGPSSPAVSSEYHWLPTSTHQDAIPSRFTSLRQARLTWDSLCEHIFRFMEFMMQYASTAPNLLPKDTQQYGAKFKLMIEAWSDAFEPLLLNRANPGVSSQEKTGIAVLKMFQIMGQILYLMTFSDSEMMFDAYYIQFRTIVDLASEVVGDEERQAAAARCPDPARCIHGHHEQEFHGHGFAHHHTTGRHIKASFSADLGIVPPLYVVATKSRDRVLRRRAIELLHSSARREGMWDSELAARIGMWVVNIEEEGEEGEFYEAMQREIGLQRQTNRGFRRRSGGIPSTPPSPTWRAFSDDRGIILPPSPDSNAGWHMRQASQTSVTYNASMAVNISPGHSTVAAAESPVPPLPLPATPASAFSTMAVSLNPDIPYYMQMQSPIPAEKRVLVKSCEFDLREHTAVLKCGTRGLIASALDTKYRIARLKW
ncbi:hypothetical protein SEPCBS119000_000432 [Sporothrix epigloea]|uniref:C6 zinc finger domain containing protein n=1 Tax=Sporothrix epigloea TaxID=1892477 RepID=A0ABP0D5J5_9PEZI